MARFLQIDWVIDLVCPWSFIGYQKLEQVLAQLDDDIHIDFHWHPFEINPSLPGGGHGLVAHLMQKYNLSALAAQTCLQRATQHSQPLPIPFSLDSDTHIYNTRKAHQLLLWAAKYNKQAALARELYHAYFVQHLPLDDSQVLLTIVSHVGLNRQEATMVLADDNWSQAVINIETQWIKAGIDAVPTMIINRSEVVSGEFDSATLGKTLTDAVSQYLLNTRH